MCVASRLFNTLVIYLGVLLISYLALSAEWGSDIHSLVESVPLSIYFHSSPVLEKTELRDYEYIVKGTSNKYLCTIDALKRYREKTKQELGAPNSSALLESGGALKTNNELIEAMGQLKNHCLWAVVMKESYIYRICFYDRVERIEFKDNLLQSKVNLGNFSAEKNWSIDEINVITNSGVDTEVKDSNFHTQWYDGGTECSSVENHDSFRDRDSRFTSSIKMYCSTDSNVTRVIGINHPKPCHLEFSISTPILCDFPALNWNYYSRSRSTIINCHPMVSEVFRDFIHLIPPFIPDNNNTVINDGTGTIYINNALFKTKYEIEILERTSLVKLITKDHQSIIKSETFGKVGDNDFDIKVNLNKLLALASNSYLRQALFDREKFLRIDTINFTNFYELAMLRGKNIESVNEFHLSSRDDNNKDVVTDDDDGSDRYYMDEADN